eukprot:PITA_33233
MDVRAVTAMAKASGAVHRAESICGLPPLRRKKGTSLRKTAQANSQIQYRNSLRRAAVKAASSNDNPFGADDSDRVDEEMIVLRKRIQELRMQETNYLPPQHWMKWEKEWSVTYASDICQFMGWLQNMLYNTRPALAITALALISVSVPTFVLLLLFQVSKFSATLIAFVREFLTKLLLGSF